MGIMHIIYIAINIHTTIIYKNMGRDYIWKKRKEKTFFQSLQWRIGATSGAGTAYPSGAPEFTPVLEGLVLLDL